MSREARELYPMSQGDILDDAERALKDILAAWMIPGPVPRYHEREKARLKKDWPALANAIERALKQHPESR